MKPRLRSRAAAAAIVAAMSVSGEARADEFVPLTTYTQQDGIAKDPAALSYIAVRCSALYLVFSAMLADETAPERKQQAAIDLQASEAFQRIALTARMAGTTSTVEAAGRDVGQSLTAISLLYQDRIKKEKALTNNMFSDGLIAGDFHICNVLHKSM